MTQVSSNQHVAMDQQPSGGNTLQKYEQIQSPEKLRKSMTIKVLDQEAKRELSKSPEKLRKSMTIKQLEEEKVSAKFTSEIHIDPKKSFITQDFKSTPRKKK